MRVTITPNQVEAWVAKYFDYKTRKGGEELRINNPFNEDTGYHFNISTTKLACNDWRGNEWAGYSPNSGTRYKCTFLRFVKLYLEQKHGRCSVLMAYEDVLGSSSSARAALTAQRLKEKQKAKKGPSLGLPEGARDLTESHDKVARSLQGWLYSRKIDARKIAKYQLLYSGFDVIWPYYEYDEMAYWQSRSRLAKRFLFPPEDIGVTKGEFLYGYDFVEPASYVVIVEAIFCCQTLEDQVVASGGAALTPKQLKKLAIIGPRDGIILAPDNDEAGLKSLLQNATILKPAGYPLYYALPPEIEYVDEDGEWATTKDWNDIARYTQENPRKVLEDSVKFWDIQAKCEITKRLPTSAKGRYLPPRR